MLGDHVSNENIASDDVETSKESASICCSTSIRDKK